MASRLEMDNKPFLQLILICSLCIVSFTLFSAFGTAVGMFYFGLTLNDLTYMIGLDQREIEGLKFIQLFSAIGLFIIPPLIYAMIRSKTPFRILGLNKLSKPINYVLVVILMVVSMVFISWIIEINAEMVLPDFMSSIEEWMRNSEEKAEKLTQAFLTFDGFGSLLYILIIVAVVPALGEELLFRGVLQKIIIKWVNSAHLGIWITAILFSALHLQFFGFFPRLLLGLVFGYIFLWTKSLWLPILGHFFNNGSVVIVSYFYPETIDGAEVSLFSNDDYAYIFYIGSFLISGGILFFIRSLNSHVQTSLPR